MTIRFAWVVASLAVGLLGCGDDTAPGPKGPSKCAAGESEGADGKCVPVEPFACATAERASADGTCSPVGALSCAPGFSLDAEGLGCVPAWYEPCGPGTRASLLMSQCVPVGWKACPSGFAATDWACEAQLPSAACSGASRAEPGSGSCVPVGDCQAAFPPANTTLFVDANFTAGELDATHFLTITQALAAAGANAVIAIESGVYSESLAIGTDVQMYGRCAAQVTVVSPNGTAPGIEVDGASDVAVQGLTLTGHNVGMNIKGGAQVTLADAIVEANTTAGIRVVGNSQLMLTDSAIRATAPGPDGFAGLALALDGGGQVIAEQIDITNSYRYAVEVLGSGSSLTLLRSVISDTRSTASGDFGNALVVRLGGDVELEQSVIRGNRESAIVALDVGTTVALSATVVRDTIPSGFGQGWGVDVGRGAVATLSDCALINNTEVGLYAVDAGSDVSVHNCAITSTKTAADGEDGAGVLVQGGARVELNSTAIIASGDYGLYAEDAGSLIAARGIVVSRGDATWGLGRGLAVFDSGQITVADGALVGNEGAAVFAEGVGASVTISDSVVASTVPDPAGLGGRGASIQFGAQAGFQRSLLIDNVGFGAFAIGEGTSVTMDAAVVMSTRAQTLDGRFGRGLGVQQGAHVNAAGTTFRQNLEANAFASGTGSMLTLAQSAVLEGQSGALDRGGQGVVVQSGASGTFSQVAWDRNRVAALQVVGEGASASIEGALLSRTTGGVSEGAGFAHGVVCADGARMTMVSSDVRANEAVGLIFSAGIGTVDTSVIQRNLIGIHVQNGVSLLEVEGTVGAPAPSEVSVSTSSVFVENQSRIGDGAVVVPDALEEGPTAD